MVAIAVEKWDLHKRLALWVLLLMGSRPSMCVKVIMHVCNSIMAHFFTTAKYNYVIVLCFKCINISDSSISLQTFWIYKFVSPVDPI